MNSDRQYDRTMELWRSYSIATSLELAAHLENFAILFSYNSGKIENREITYHDTHEIFKNGRVVPVLSHKKGKIFTRLKI